MTEKGTNLGTLEKSEMLAIEGGKPVRTVPLPLEFPGVDHMNEEEEQAVLRVIRSRSLFSVLRYRSTGSCEAASVRRRDARNAAECPRSPQSDAIVHPIARSAPSGLSINPGIGSRVKQIF